jgi:multiple sugar transport system permease protein
MRLKIPIAKIVAFTISIIYLGFNFIPLYDALLVSLSPYVELFKYPRIIIPPAYFNNYIELLLDWTFVRTLLNTTIYATSTSLLSLAIATPAAYALSRFTFKGRVTYLFAILVTNMISVLVLIFPLKMLMIAFGLDNTYFAVIFIDALFRLAFSIWMLWAFFDTVPKDIDEAAMVDGCSRIRAMVFILLPLIAPGLFTTLLFNIVAEWQSFTVPIIFITNRDLIPVTVELFSRVEELTPEWNVLMAGAFIAIIPELALAYGLQRYLIRGLTGGAVKG